MRTDECDCWRRAFDNWSACYYKCTIGKPHDVDPVEITFADVLIVRNEANSTDEIGVVYTISTNPSYGPLHACHI